MDRMPKSEKCRLVGQSVYSSFWKEGGFVLLGGVCVVWMDIWELRKSPTCLRRRLPFPLRLFFSTTSLPRSHFHLISLPPPFFIIIFFLPSFSSSSSLVWDFHNVGWCLLLYFHISRVGFSEEEDPGR